MQTDNKYHDIQYFQCEVNTRKYISQSMHCQWNRVHEWWFENRRCIKSKKGCTLKFTQARLVHNVGICCDFILIPIYLLNV